MNQFYTTVFCVLSVFLEGCGFEQKGVSQLESSKSPRPLAVSVLRVESIQNSRETKTVYAKIVPNREVELSFERGGKVVGIEKSVGDLIAEGDVIASLEQGEIIHRQRQLQDALMRENNSLPSATIEATPAIRKRIAQLEAQLQGIEATLKKGLILAPFAGVISSVHLELNQTVPPSLPVVKIIEDAPPLLRAALVESVSNLISDGQAVWTDFGNRSNLVNVLSRSPIRGALSGEVITFEFDGDLASESWSYGEVVELSFFHDVEESGSWIPLSVLQKTVDEEWAVYVAKPTDETKTVFNVERRAVKVIRVLNGKALIGDSLLAGELVIRDGLHRIVVNQQVEIPASSGVAK